MRVERENENEKLERVVPPRCLGVDGSDNGILGLHGVGRIQGHWSTRERQTDRQIHGLLRCHENSSDTSADLRNQLDGELAPRACLPSQLGTIGKKTSRRTEFSAYQSCWPPLCWFPGCVRLSRCVGNCGGYFTAIRCVASRRRAPYCVVRRHFHIGCVVIRVALRPHSMTPTFSRGCRCRCRRRQMRP